MAHNIIKWVTLGLTIIVTSFLSYSYGNYQGRQSMPLQEVVQCPKGYSITTELGTAGWTCKYTDWVYGD
jgi:hypothetical protein